MYCAHPESQLYVLKIFQSNNIFARSSMSTSFCKFLLIRISCSTVILCQFSRKLLNFMKYFWHCISNNHWLSCNTSLHGFYSCSSRSSYGLIKGFDIFVDTGAVLSLLQIFQTFFRIYIPRMFCYIDHNDFSIADCQICFATFVEKMSHRESIYSKSYYIEIHWDFLVFLEKRSALDYQIFRISFQQTQNWIALDGN